MKKIKGFISTLLIFVLLVPSLTVSASANENKIKEVEPGVFIGELSDDQVIENYNKFNIVIPEKINTEYLGNIVDDMTLYKTEEETASDGTKYIYDYYKLSYKNTNDANFLKKQIANLKKSGNDNVTPFAERNDEGDVRIVTSFEPIVEQTKFDSVKKNLRSNLAAKSYEKYFSLLSGKLISNYVVGFFVGELQNDLLKGLQGSGDATGYFRLAKKTGQVYRNGSFKSYFETYQQEWYWKHEAVTYNSNGSIKNAATTYYLPDSFGYLPINWVYSTYFYSNKDIIEIAQHQYRVEPNRSTPAKDIFKSEGYRNDWKTKGKMSY
ncbi:hypothetical protein [Paenibacillus sp. Z3-2]